MLLSPPTPSPSLSADSPGSLGKASPLSPTPSLSVSAVAVDSLGNASLLSPIPPPSLSKGSLGLLGNASLLPPEPSPSIRSRPVCARLAAGRRMMKFTRHAAALVRWKIFSCCYRGRLLPRILFSSCFVLRSGWLLCRSPRAMPSRWSLLIQSHGQVAPMAAKS